MKKKIFKLIVITLSLFLMSGTFNCVFAFTESYFDDVLFTNYPSSPELFKYLPELKKISGGEAGTREITFTKDEQAHSIHIEDNAETGTGNYYLYYDDSNRIIHSERIDEYFFQMGDLYYYDDLNFNYIDSYNNTYNVYFDKAENVWKWENNGNYQAYQKTDRELFYDNKGRIIRARHPYEGWETYFEYEDTSLHTGYSFSASPNSGVSTINRQQGTGTPIRFTIVTSGDVEEVSILADKFEGQEWHEITYDYLKNNYEVIVYVDATTGLKTWIYEFDIHDPGYRTFILKINGCQTNLETNVNITQNSGSFSPTPQQNISVEVNGRVLEFDVPPQIINDRTMVPVRGIFEALGASVSWNEKTQTVTAMNDDRWVQLVIGSTELKWLDYKENVFESTISLDSPAVIIDGRTLVPARAVARAFGCTVEWDEDTKTVNIY